VAPPLPPGLSAPAADAVAGPASGLLLFRLPKGAEAAIDGVPIGLSDGLGIHALPPGQHVVTLQVSGKASEYKVNIRSNRIFTVSPVGITAAEP
jgi:hypothetical protein